MSKTSRRRGAGRVNLYTNLVAKRRSRIDSYARKHAEYLSSLPKQPLKRLFYRLKPKRIIHYWFSREGLMMMLKFAGVGLLLLVILVSALFAYYRHQLDLIRPSELSKRVQTTVSKYYDRNGVLLWEDRGDGDFKLVVESKNISDNMKHATVAIEDKDFYNHAGVSINGLLRASFFGGSHGGGSTLTQQLVKNVFFSSSLKDRTLSRKVKEAILAIEVERMYNKDQILTLYLNEVPYGGRRDGVESAAQTYFGKSAKDLSLPEAALLASIPQNPSLFNPYNLDGNKALIERQHTVLDYMADQGYITKQEAANAKKVAILDTIKPEIAGNEDIKAPHFVLEVRSQLEQEFGQKVVRGGGLTIKTTLDYRLQKIAEQAVDLSVKKTPLSFDGSDNIAFTAVDVPTGQILSMVGSYDFNDKNYGQRNAATSRLSPGSSFKVFDYSQLFTQRPGQNYGAGSVIEDKNVDNIWCAGFVGKCTLQNFDGKFFGAISIRDALSNSRNTPAAQAAYIAGIDNIVKLAHDMGDLSYCTGDKEEVNLSASIGGNCTVLQSEHVNAYATLARGGIYQPESYVLEVKNSQDQTLKQWKDQSKRVIDPQIPYIISDILNDDGARARVFGHGALGMSIPYIKTSTKTGTTDDGNGHSKDHWMMSYSPRIAAGVWVGRHDGHSLQGVFTPATGTVIDYFMRHAHFDIFQKDGSWKADDWFTKPTGIQTINVNGRNDLFPSWYTKPKAADGVKMTFDKVSKKKATNCTPDGAKQEVTIQGFQDPITNKINYASTDGFDPNADDDIHHCADARPFVSLTAQQAGGNPNTYHITATVNQGTFPLQSVDIKVDGVAVSSQAISAAGNYSTDYTFTSSGSKVISVVATDQGWYDATATKTVTITSAPSTPSPTPSPTPQTPVLPPVTPPSNEH
ncbi:MAG TPA: transglycosylase domain-containing protein [Patescibacteria group bacterium]|jgi:membrane peptidoglycan carboxypeptidase|nr:transglycosylase domain-containing protein [Patescibacteria group bacterium]